MSPVGYKHVHSACLVACQRLGSTLAGAQSWVFLNYCIPDAPGCKGGVTYLVDTYCNGSTGYETPPGPVNPDDGSKAVTSSPGSSVSTASTASTSSTACQGLDPTSWQFQNFCTSGAPGCKPGSGQPSYLVDNYCSGQSYYEQIAAFDTSSSSGSSSSSSTSNTPASNAAPANNAVQANNAAVSGTTGSVTSSSPCQALDPTGWVYLNFCATGAPACQPGSGAIPYLVDRYCTGQSYSDQIAQIEGSFSGSSSPVNAGPAVNAASASPQIGNATPQQATASPSTSGDNQSAKCVDYVSRGLTADPLYQKYCSAGSTGCNAANGPTDFLFSAFCTASTPAGSNANTNAASSSTVPASTGSITANTSPMCIKASSGDQNSWLYRTYCAPGYTGCAAKQGPVDNLYDLFCVGGTSTSSSPSSKLAADKAFFAATTSTGPSVGRGRSPGFWVGIGAGGGAGAVLLISLLGLGIYKLGAKARKRKQMRARDQESAEASLRSNAASRYDVEDEKRYEDEK